MVVELALVFHLAEARQNFIIQNHLLANPKFRQAAGELLGQGLNPDEVITNPRLQQALDARSIARTALQEKVDSQAEEAIGLDRAHTVDELTKFTPDATDPTHVDGNRLKELADAERADRARSTTLEGWINILTPARKTDLENNVMTARATGAPMDPDEARYDEHLKLKDKMTELDGLRNKKQLFQKRVKELDDIDRLAVAVADTEDNYQRVKRGVDQRQAVKLERIVHEAADKILKQELEDRIRLQGELEAKSAGEADTEYEKKFKLLTRDRWERTRYVRGQRVFAGVNQVAVNRDYHNMIIQDGPDQSIRDLLTGALPPIGHPDLAAEQAKMEQLLQDEGFMSKARNHFVKGVVSRYLLSGGRASEHEIRILRDTTWGQNAIMSGIEENGKLREEIEKVRGAGGLGGAGGRLEWLRHLPTRDIMWILLVLLGLGGATLLGRH